MRACVCVCVCVCVRAVSVSCPVLSCPVLSCPVLPCPALPLPLPLHLPLPCAAPAFVCVCGCVCVCVCLLSFLDFPCLVLSRLALSCLASSCLALLWLARSSPVRACTCTLHIFPRGCMKQQHLVKFQPYEPTAQRHATGTLASTCAKQANWAFESSNACELAKLHSCPIAGNYVSGW